MSKTNTQELYVMPMSIYNNSTFSPSVVWHRCGGKLPGHCNSSISVSSISLHESTHLSTCLLWQSSWQTASSSDVNHINILEYTVHFRAYTALRNQGATNTEWMIHTDIDTVISHVGTFSWSMWGSLRCAPVIAKFKDYVQEIHLFKYHLLPWLTEFWSSSHNGVEHSSLTQQSISNMYSCSEHAGT